MYVDYSLSHRAVCYCGYDNGVYFIIFGLAEYMAVYPFSMPRGHVLKNFVVQRDHD